ncbi:MAG TPA: hypothetical protein VG269_12430 [Tepidisphaeraceae bacterium]|jgi:hypothetical protein|nr:hypothetical protein [Tepidisphaeraceae bacterium]
MAKSSESADGNGKPSAEGKTPLDAESRRLDEDASRAKNWKRWGPYLSERQWATVREDYSVDGDCWNYFPHDHARSRAYRWGEDGLLGFTDRECRLCFAVALWNGKDPILKERLFGLTGPEGNHGEDAKEYYFYLDSTPTHSYCKAVYKYPQAAFPYEDLVAENRRRTRKDPEFELIDTGVFEGDRYFDVTAEYAKNSPDDILIKLTIDNRGPDAAELHLLPTLWFRNSWAWGCTHEGCTVKPRLSRTGPAAVVADHPTLGRYYWEAEASVQGVAPELLFTDNETNIQRLFHSPNTAPHVKDAFDEYIVHGRAEAVDPRGLGTKAAACYRFTVPAKEQIVVRLRLCPEAEKPAQAFGPRFEQVFAQRIAEADAFYGHKIRSAVTPAERQVARQAFAGLLWSKQFYHYVVADWLDGDPNQPKPPKVRKRGRNSDWRHVFARDVISMPDKWEYPWFAAWDLAFHMIPFATIDPDFAKGQLLLLLREWYTHPNGQLPAYEFAFNDVNPPVHAWACWRVYKITAARGQRDHLFLERTFQKLLINFTWWVNRKDPQGKHLFAGGFLGLDNIGMFDRNQPLPTGGTLEQADGTAWMAFYCTTMLAMALELARYDPAYEDVASKFFEHFVAITDAMNSLGGTGLWNEEDGFYYDQIYLDGRALPLKVRSMVGIIPLFACEILESDVIDRLPGFSKRMRWFLEHRPDLARYVTYMQKRSGTPGDAKAQGDGKLQDGGKPPGTHYLLAIPSRQRLERVLRYVLDETEFLSPYGLRSVSRYHKDHPCVFNAEGKTYGVQYVSGESDTPLFGGNSNWRGPIWFPLNYLLIEALERYHHFFGEDLKVEYPTGSGKKMTLAEVSQELSRRLSALFLPDAQGVRPYTAGDPRVQGVDWNDMLQFHEYFDGDTGRGCGASHQTGWTGLIARLVQECGRKISAQAGGQSAEPQIPAAVTK